VTYGRMKKEKEVMEQLQLEEEIGKNMPL